jgi:hypothetical protein
MIKDLKEEQVSGATVSVLLLFAKRLLSEVLANCFLRPRTFPPVEFDVGDDFLLIDMGLLDYPKSRLGNVLRYEQICRVQPAGGALTPLCL